MPGQRVKINAEQTIKFVNNLENFLIIWNVSEKKFHSKPEKDSSWKQLAEIVGISVEELKKVYKTHRKYFGQVSTLIITKIFLTKRVTGKFEIIIILIELSSFCLKVYLLKYSVSLVCR